VNRLKIIFIRNCINSDVFPSHLYGQFKNFDGSFYTTKQAHSFNNLKKRFLRNILKLELLDIYNYIRIAHNKLYIISLDLEECIPLSICISFFNRQSRSLFTYYLRERDRYDRKFRFLVSRQKENINIDPIHYYYHITAPQPKTLGDSQNNYSFNYSIKNNNHIDTSEVLVHPESFTDNHNNT